MASAPATADAVAVPLLLPLDDAAAAAGRGCWEDGAISLGLVGVQLAGAAYMVVVTPVLALGLDPLFLVAFGSLCTAILTIPFAVKLERFEFYLSMIMHASPLNYHFFVLFFTFFDRSANLRLTTMRARMDGAGRNGHRSLPAGCFSSSSCWLWEGKKL